MAEDNDVWYGGTAPEISELNRENLEDLNRQGDRDSKALDVAKEHHAEISKPEGFPEDELAVRYTDDDGKEKDIIAKRKPGNDGNPGNDEFDFWEPEKNPNTGKYMVHAEIENDLLTLGLNLYARNFYAKWYAEQKQAEAAQQMMGNPEQIADGLKNEVEKQVKESSGLRDELGLQGRQAPQTGGMSVEERLDRIERNQQIMMDQLNRIEENQRSFFDKFLDKLSKGLEMLANGIEKVSKKIDKTADGLLLTSGAIQRGFDRLYGKAPVAEYPSTPQQEQKQAQGARDNSLGQDDIKDLKRIISELTNEVKGLKERIGQLEKDNKRLNEENNKLNKENRELFAQIQTGRQNNAPEKQSERRGPENREEAKAAPKVEEKAEQKFEQKKEPEAKEQNRPESNPESRKARKGQTEDELDKYMREHSVKEQQNNVPEKQPEEAQPRQKEQDKEKQDASTLNRIDPDAELRNKNVLANNIVTGGHLEPLADASNVADEFKNVVNSKELLTPAGFETAFVYTALKNDEFNSNFVLAFNKMREEDRNWDNPERTNLECIVDLAQIALNESLRHDSTAVLCQGAGNTECFAYPKDQFNFDFSNSITLRDMTLSIARENGEILHLSEEEAHNLSKMHLNDLREKLPESIQMAQYIGEVLEEMDISLKKGINLQPAELREAIKSNASEVINSFEQEGMNRQQAINATYNGYLKKLKYDASTVINNRIISAQGANGLEKIKRREADGSLKEISGAEAGFIDRDGNRYSLGAMDLRKKDVELTVGSEDKGERGENFERNGLKKQGMIR